MPSTAMTCLTPVQKFTALIRERGGKHLWETSCNADGEKFRLECWSVPRTKAPSEGDRLVMIQRWRDGTCTVFRPHTASTSLSVGLTDLASYLD